MNTFRTHQDGFNLGRCLLVKTNIARRTGEIETAMAWLGEAKTAEWPGEKAKISLQQGYLQWLNQGDYAGAITTFMEVIQVFTALDMPVWAAQAQDGLAQVYTITGNLREAEHLLQQALDQATAYEATSLRVAILLDTGWYYAQRGDPEQSLSHLQLAAQLSEQTGSPIMQAIILMHLGDACIQLGRYQLALRYLEKSYDRFKQMGNISRLAECELRLAQTWLALGQAQMSQLYLTQASDNARQASHPTIWPYLSYRRALTYLQQEQPDSAQTALEEGLQIAQQQSDPHSIAIMQRGLATLLLSLHKPHEAYPYLTAATDSFQAMNMAYEELDCFIPWGQYHILNGDQDQARQTWDRSWSRA